MALLIGNDPEIEQALHTLLEPHGWSVRLANDNVSALERIKLQNFDLIITDSHSSGAEDVELLRKMRRFHANTRMIIVTDESTPKDVIEAMKERAFSYFAKPFSLEHLEDIIHMAVDGPCWDDGIEVLAATPDWIDLLVRCDASTADRLMQFLEDFDLPDKEARSGNGVSRDFVERDGTWRTV
jgi:CheY-like chemotaxis protein